MDTVPKKRGRGRPPSAETARNSVQVWFRCTPSQDRRWHREAEKAGLPLRTWIKVACARASDTPIDFTDRAQEAVDCIRSTDLTTEEAVDYLAQFLKEVFADG